MPSHSKDWRETERRLSELPDEKLRIALSEAGVKAVLPSHKKPRPTSKTPGQIGDATARWAKGDWEERISIDLAGLPDAQKFLADPNKPPTVAIQQSTPLASRPAPGRPWKGLVWGLTGTAAMLTVGLLALSDSSLLERPQITARTAAAHAQSKRPGSESSAAAQTGDRELPALAVPAGSEHALAPEDRKQTERRRRALARQAKDGDVNAMLALAQEMLDAGNAQTAMKWAGRAKRADRRSIEARILLGDAQMLAGYSKAAERTWRAALARAPHNKALRQRLHE